MKIDILEHNGTKLAEILSDATVINDAQDALDLMASCDYLGSKNLMIKKEQIHEDFFDLKTGLAGEILQKFSNYQTRCAVIGDFRPLQSKNLKDFMRESNRMGRILFVSTRETAIQGLSQGR